MTGFATSVIACGCEAGIERELAPEETPDGRPGDRRPAVRDGRARTWPSSSSARVGQCVLTCAGTACFSGLDGEATAPLGKALRYFGDGFQSSKRLGGRRYWRLPVMDGEFLVEDDAGVVPGVGGGNFLILVHHGRAWRRPRPWPPSTPCARLPNVIMPFPGGIVRSGSKVGSQLQGPDRLDQRRLLPDPPRPERRAPSLPDEVEAVLEIVIDGLSEADVAAATAVGVRAACGLGRAAGVVAISAGNYGGQLGPYHFHLRKVLQ